MTPIDLAPAAARMATVIRGIAPEHLDRPTPCAEYNVADLLDHVTSFAAAFTAAASKTAGAPPRAADGASLPADWQQQIPAAIDELVVAWQAPGALDGMSRAGGFELPADVVAAIAVEELVLHGWDLARASGQDYDADEASAGVALGVVTQFNEPGQGSVRDSAYAAPRSAAAGASTLDPAIAVSGREVSWSAP